MCSVEPVDCQLATGGVLAPLGPVFAPAEPSPRVVTPSVALARAHLGSDMAVRGMEAARVMAERPSSNLAAGCICQLHFVKRSACRACAQIRFHLTQAEVHKPESQSCFGKACCSGELRCCAKHQPCSHLRYARSVADWALVAMLTVTSSSKWRIVQLQTWTLARPSCTTLRRTASANCWITISSASIASPSTSSTLLLLHSPTTSFMALACERCAVFSERKRVNSPLSVSLPLPFFCVLFFAILIPCLSSSAFARFLARCLSCISFIPLVFNSW